MIKLSFRSFYSDDELWIHIRQSARDSNNEGFFIVKFDKSWKVEQVGVRIRKNAQNCEELSKHLRDTADKLSALAKSLE